MGTDLEGHQAPLFKELNSLLLRFYFQPDNSSSKNINNDNDDDNDNDDNNHDHTSCEGASSLSLRAMILQNTE